MPAGVHFDFGFSTKRVGATILVIFHQSNISYGLKRSTSYACPRNPYIKSQGAAVNIRLLCPCPWCSDVMMDTPTVLRVSISSRVSSSLAGNRTVGNVRTHSARSMSGWAAWRDKLIPSTAVRTMPFISRSRTRRREYVWNSFAAEIVVEDSSALKVASYSFFVPRSPTCCILAA